MLLVLLMHPKAFSRKLSDCTVKVPAHVIPTIVICVCIYTYAVFGERPPCKMLKDVLVEAANKVFRRQCTKHTQVLKIWRPTWRLTVIRMISCQRYLFCKVGDSWVTTDKNSLLGGFCPPYVALWSFAASLSRRRWGMAKNERTSTCTCSCTCANKKVPKAVSSVSSVRTPLSAIRNRELLQ